ncbi:DNA-7-methylguanine glycosylase [Paenibacillus uliginis N3/975]|uniref:DNA-7-methylguanine glycosylase n=1 Tax=Paenibacillus uliginis N3/975 TaxID=1313296 RepID=A0A1X7HF80_9BACL|nr:DNA-7-methylguanine glycosylase [Paenibacillus uliginis N3/975]
MNLNDLNQLRNLFLKNANPFLALKMKSYMRNQFEFFGIQSPLRRELTSQFLKEYGFPHEEQVVETITELWNMNERELQNAALQVIDMRKRKFHQEDIKLIEQITIEKSWWDTVDHIASNHAGHYFSLYPEQLFIADRWIESDNFWLQRSAILYQLKYKHNTDAERLFTYIRKVSESNEFFIQKAIGWSLRQYSKYNPEAVRDFVESNPLSNLSKREALKVLNRTSLS